MSVLLFFLRSRRPPRSTRTDTLCPYTTLFRSLVAALRGVDREDLRLALLLPSATVLRRPLALPLAARDNLLQVVAFEMDRQTPFTAAQVYYTVRELATPAPPGRFNVELVAVPRGTPDPQIGRAHV